MFRPFLNSLMLGSMFFPFIAIAGSTAQGGVIHFYGQIVEPACDVSTQSSPVE
ncbi:type 1 fimbrial protein, partial [Escherichia coli]|nr:type 1 fimbrial protein [Escherichia coli]